MRVAQHFPIIGRGRNGVGVLDRGWTQGLRRRLRGAGFGTWGGGEKEVEVVQLLLLVALSDLWLFGVWRDVDCFI